MKINGFDVTQYSKADKDKIEQIINPLKVTMTQSEAGFKSKVHEHFETVEMRPITYQLAERLKKDLVILTKKIFVLANLF